MDTNPLTDDASPYDVTLRDVTVADLPIFFDHQLDPDATAMAAFHSRDKETFMAHWQKAMNDETVTLKTILYNGQVAGNVVSFVDADKTYVGYWLGKEFWGKGIATRALAEFLKHVQPRPLYAIAARKNRASIRVLEKCGFTVCGVEFILDEAGETMIEEVIMML